MATRRYRVLFAEDTTKLAALIAQPQYAGWTFFENPLAFSELEADHNFVLVPPDEARLSVQGPGVFTVGFAP
ncbi:MAG: hypothetical protein KIT17_00100 [Rubrivivax sp.]|nr:hypothetical protein [Rubrivivax sp.]